MTGGQTKGGFGMIADHAVAEPEGARRAEKELKKGIGAVGDQQHHRYFDPQRLVDAPVQGSEQEDEKLFIPQEGEDVEGRHQPGAQALQPLVDGNFDGMNGLHDD